MSEFNRDVELALEYSLSGYYESQQYFSQKMQYEHDFFSLYRTANYLCLLGKMDFF